MCVGTEVVWDAEMAQQMSEMLEKARGGPGPCKTGKRCPILPRTLAILPKVTEVVMRGTWGLALLTLLAAGPGFAAA